MEKSEKQEESKTEKMFAGMKRQLESTAQHF